MSGLNRESLTTAAALIANIEASLKKLRLILDVDADVDDPADPRNKNEDGKLTERGVLTCYRLFDEGKTRYAVAQLMGLSFGAATHRFHAWEKARRVAAS